MRKPWLVLALCMILISGTATLFVRQSDASQIVFWDVDLWYEIPSGAVRLQWENTEDPIVSVGGGFVWLKRDGHIDIIVPQSKLIKLQIANIGGF